MATPGLASCFVVKVYDQRPVAWLGDESAESKVHAFPFMLHTGLLLVRSDAVHRTRNSVANCTPGSPKGGSKGARFTSVQFPERVWWGSRQRLNFHFDVVDLDLLFVVFDDLGSKRRATIHGTPWCHIQMHHVCLDFKEA